MLSTCHQIHILFFSYLFIFRDRGREGVRGRETLMWEKKHRLAASCRTHLGTWPATQACALTRKWTSSPLVCKSNTNPLSPTSQGKYTVFNLSFLLDVQHCLHPSLLIPAKYLHWGRGVRWEGKDFLRMRAVGMVFQATETQQLGKGSLSLCCTSQRTLRIPGTGR